MKLCVNDTQSLYNVISYGMPYEEFNDDDIVWFRYIPPFNRGKEPTYIRFEDDFDI